MTGNVLIKNRTPSSDVPYLFGLPKQKTTLLRHTSVLRSKTLAEGEFTSPEHFNFLPESKKRRAKRLARGTAVPRHAQRATNAPPGRFLASLAPCSTLCPLEPKNRRFCAVQAFCAAKPWRRANSLRPSILISCRNPKKGGRRGSLAALPCRDTHNGRQTPHRGVFSLRSRPVRPSARWGQKIKA